MQDHIAEVMSKWHSIDDEIWAKIIVLERNRRVAKAYARAPVLTVNGSDDGFDGFRDEEDDKKTCCEPYLGTHALGLVFRTTEIGPI